jgi:hypothetical protein
MDKLDFYINWYNREEERKVSLDNSLNIPIGILTIIFAILFFLLKEFDFWNTTQLYIYLIIFLVGISFISALIVSLYLFKSYHNIFVGYEYKGIPYPSLLLNHEYELINYYESYKDHFPGITGEEKFKEYLINKIVELTDINSFNNDKKSEFLHKAKGYTGISLNALILAFIPFISNSVNKRSKTINEERFLNAELNDRINNLEFQLNYILTMSEKPLPPPPPPKPPSDRTIREGQIPLPPSKPSPSVRE